MQINHNIAALNTYRQLSSNQASGNKSLEKLSSGLRINKAGDDAAGLAISEKMRAQIRGLDQASRNSQDAISLMQTAEGALNETQSILQRMRELAVQAATDTNVNVDREEIQKEINQLSSEINRIGNTTEFNTMKLMNGDLAKVINGYAKGKITVGSDIKITEQAVAAAVTGTNYAAAGDRNLVDTNATFTGAITINELSTIQQGINNELNLEIDGVQHNINMNTVVGTGGSGFAAGSRIHDLNLNFTGNLSVTKNLDITVDGYAQQTDVVLTKAGVDYSGAGAAITVRELFERIEYDLNNNAKLTNVQIGEAAGNFKVGLVNGNIAITNTAKSFKIDTATTGASDALAKLSASATALAPSTNGIKGTDTIIQVMNFELRSRGIGATVNYDDQSRLEFKTDTLGNTGSVKVIGGNFAAAFVGETSSNSALISAMAKKDDKFSVILEGASGELHTIELTAVENKENPLANQFKEVTTDPVVANQTIANQATNIREALDAAIQANDDLKGRYFINLDETGSNIRVTGAAVGDGYSISQFTITKASTGTLAGDGGTAMDATGTVSVGGKDVHDAFVHKDLGASITGSVEMTNTALRKTNIIIAPANDEFTFNVDNNKDTTTVVMENKTYDGTAQTFATGTVRFVQGAPIADGDIWESQLKGLDGTTVDLTLTAQKAGDIPNNSKTEFLIGTNTSDTVANMADSVARAIDADDKLKGLYAVSVQNGNEITITATKATSELAVADLNTAGSTGAFLIADKNVVESVNQLGNVGKAAETLRDDLQAKIDATVWSTYNDKISSKSTADGNLGAGTGDIYKVNLEGADGMMVAISLASSAATTSSTSFSRAVDTEIGNAYSISKALNLAIEASDNLKGRYEASNLGDTLTIKAINAGDGHKIVGVQETADATFAVTQGTDADAQRTASATVSIQNNRMVLSSDNTGVGSEINIGGSNPALAIFGELSGRVYQARLAENDTMTLNVDGSIKSVAINNQVYQDVNEFISVNQAAFNEAGVTASNDNGHLKLTSNVSGRTSQLDNINGEADILKQLGLQQASGEALTAGHFIKGADGNTKLVLNVDGENIEANLQQGTYKDINVLAKAVESAINLAKSALTRDVRVTVEDGKLTVSSTNFGSGSKIVLGTHESLDAAGILGLTEREEKTGVDGTAKLNFQIGANQGQSMALSINDMRSMALGVSSVTKGFEVAGVENAMYTTTHNVTDGTSDENIEYALDVSTHLKAAGAVTVINKAIEAVSAERSKLGAASNRLDHTINNLGTSAENMTAAESRIRDVDMAKEMMEFTKNNILSQAAVAMLERLAA